MKRGKENAESSSSCDSSSSEDEEELSRLREAALGLTTDLKAKNENFEVSKESKKQVQKKSLRTDLKEEVIEDELLQATPEFKKFASKQLAAHLESLISDVEILKRENGKDDKKPTADKDDTTSGIRLLASSLTLLQTDGCHDNKNTKKTQKMRKSSLQSSDSEEENEKWKEAAISVDYILANSSRLQVTPKESSCENKEQNVSNPKKKKKRKAKKDKKVENEHGTKLKKKNLLDEE